MVGKRTCTHCAVRCTRAGECDTIVAYASSIVSMFDAIALLKHLLPQKARMSVIQLWLRYMSS
eukprot:2880092-Pyramimonas_sp.AAC.1